MVNVSKAFNRTLFGVLVLSCGAIGLSILLRTKRKQDERAAQAV